MLLVWNAFFRFMHIMNVSFWNDHVLISLYNWVQYSVVDHTAHYCISAHLSTSESRIHVLLKNIIYFLVNIWFVLKKMIIQMMDKLRLKQWYAIQNSWLLGTLSLENQFKEDGQTLLRDIIWILLISYKSVLPKEIQVYIARVEKLKSTAQNRPLAGKPSQFGPCCRICSFRSKILGFGRCRWPILHGLFVYFHARQVVCWWWTDGDAILIFALEHV